MWLAVILGASFFVFTFFVGQNTPVGEALNLGEIRPHLNNAISITVTMAIGLGVINLLYVHGANILRRKQGWPFSIVVFATFGLVVTALILSYIASGQEQALAARTGEAVEAYEDAAAIEDPVARDEAFAALSEETKARAAEYYAAQAEYDFELRQFYLSNVFNPLAQSVMGLLGFYITFAAYRAFRLRSVEASVMMISAAIVILGSDPIGGWMSVQLNELFSAEWLDLPALADLNNRVMNSGMQRGLWIGIHIAILAVALRVLLGLERGMFEVRSSEE
jgi:ABC-type multidrug transport system fused ATPase/permease subunit